MLARFVRRVQNLQVKIKQQMSHRRIRHLQSPSLLASPPKLDTNPSASTSFLKRRAQTSDSGVRGGTRMTKSTYMQRKDSVFNRNITFFRENFNPNDSSQLPFMSSLRDHPRDSEPPKATSMIPFETSDKTTYSQAIPKRVSDFRTKGSGMASVFFRWHNQSGRNSRWSTDYGCSLRRYGSKHIEAEKGYYNYIKPVRYEPVQKRIYDKSELVGLRNTRTFSVKQ